MASVLIVDDDNEITRTLASCVQGLGHDLEICRNDVASIERLHGKTVDVVFCAADTAALGTLPILTDLRRGWPDAVVVVTTAPSTIPSAIEAMRCGAYDYVVKPFSVEQVGHRLGRALEVATLRRENRVLRTALGRPAILESASPKMRRVIDVARQAANSNVSVLLTGEGGTGKGVLAAAIHGWSSRVSDRFVSISCTTLSDPLLESELFGDVQGGATEEISALEAAVSGTIFFDEVGDLTPPLQAKLLRIVEERRYTRATNSQTVRIGARILAATSRNLEAEVTQGTWRRDLFYRLNVVSILVPPLRERTEDLPALTRHVLATHASRHGHRALGLAPDAEAALAAYAWPGNVRELFHVLEHAIVVCGGSDVRIRDLPERFHALTSTDPHGREDTPLDDVRREHIERVLSDSSSLETAAARLGISSTTLWRRRKRYGIRQ